MNYEQKYKEALERAKEELRVCGSQDCDAARQIFRFFPELAESEDERIRKEIVDFITSSNKYGTNERCEAWLNWLEKQREKSTIIDVDKMVMEYSQTKDGDFGLPVNCMTRAYRKGIDDALKLLNQGEQLTDKVEPKFKVGDWVVRKDEEPFCNGNKYVRITNIDREQYWFDSGSWLKAKDIRLWTINDAKDGDVLATEDGRPFIIRCMVESKNDIPSAYCGINARPIEAFIITGYSPGTSKWTNSKVHPATKEQRDLLFQKMKEAGYEWDADKKE